MEVQLSTSLFFFLSTTLLLASTTAGHFFSPISDDTDYIRTSCETTRYPQTCFKSLSGYSGAIQHDPGRLARVAIHVALFNATHMANYVSDIPRRNDSGNTLESAALNDCSSVFGDAVDEIRQSYKEMKRLGWTGESVKFQLSNVQTWMSAALTNENTCTDGFEQVADSGVKADVCDRVVTVTEVTSNALALVNSYADKITA
ncbi:pectinesterase inhibitor 7-like [Cynara cardunculus var. scolymus]|uniref:pectinesterase n=1 Tax=Cynara cardunculus var. scolymus TaxID=59895 RepID=A0A118K360_CYNCS|nr:pectinesterase inhibitor 7-like [Cynara cardunculus var. scolymus]KVI05432.1 Pectinesterase inhibitor [Cynara cardunculus var. scolymus]